MMKLGMVAVLALALGGCTTTEKNIARTAIDLADGQCVNVVPLLAGDASPELVKPICATADDLRAVFDSILAAQRAAAARKTGGGAAAK